MTGLPQNLPSSRKMGGGGEGKGCLETPCRNNKS